LLQDYISIGVNPRFLRLALAGSLGFGGLFLYIASAPAFILDLLHMNERQFAWLFIPTIGGMALGAYASGRAAGRVDGARAVRIGYGFMAVAAVYNVAYNAFAAQMSVLLNIGYVGLAPQFALPWAVMPIFLGGMGMALIFPILTLAILDMYPRQRGTASSMQAFSTLVTNAIIAGVLSPLLSRSGLTLAIGAALFAVGSGVMWKWERISQRARREQAPS